VRRLRVILDECVLSQTRLNSGIRDANNLKVFGADAIAFIRQIKPVFPNLF
jgi:hypothetical protein